LIPWVRTMYRGKHSNRVWKSVAGLVRLSFLLGLLLAAAVPSSVVAPVLSAPVGQDEPGTSASGESTAGPGGLGMVPSGPDKQRLVRLPERLGAAENLPEAVDLTESALLLEGQPSGEGIPLVGDQQWTNTCTGWAASYYYKTYQEWLEHEWNLQNGTANYDHIFSPNFVYNQITGVTDYNCDDGAEIGDALALIVEEGDLPYSQFPWNPYNCGVQPSPAQKTAALEYDGINYGAFFISVGPPYGPELNHNLTPLKQWLAGDDPFVLGFPIYSEFDNYDCFEVVTPPANPGSYRGLHAVAVVGYDDNWAGVGGFKIVNSWGEDWGCYGYAWLSYSFVREYGWEAWWMTSNRRPWIDPQVPDRYSPNLGETIIVDLTPYENDREESGTGLKWYVEGADHCIVYGQGSSNDVLSFQPSPAGYTGYDEITLILRDSEGAEDTQELTLGWFDLNITYYLPLGLSY
jgi:hypothetical protein